MVVEQSGTTSADYSRGLQAWVDSPRPALGDALIGLSTHQNDAKLRQECLASAQEAFDIFFELSEQFPDQFRHHFGLARHNLGMAKFGIDDNVGGLREMEEAAAIFEPLAKAHPGAYAPFYAHVLGSLVRAYVKNERNAEALRQEELCVEVYRNLNKQTSGRFASQLKNHLDILRGLYDDLGNPEGAKNVASEISELTSSR